MIGSENFMSVFDPRIFRKARIETCSAEFFSSCQSSATLVVHEKSTTGNNTFISD